MPQSAAECNKPQIAAVLRSAVNFDLISLFAWEQILTENL
jgi:hypothetical protein